MNTGQIVKVWTHHLMCPTTGEQLGYDESKFDLWMLLDEGYHDGVWEALCLTSGKVFTLGEWEMEIA